MANFVIRNGLFASAKLPETQIFVIGRYNALKKSKYLGILAEKLQGINETHYNSALEQLNAKGGSVPLHLNCAKLVGVSDSVSRYNSPSNAHSICKELKGLSISNGITKLSIVLYAEYEHVFASVAAIAKSFPLFTQKTSKEGKFQLEEISVEIVTTDKELQSKDIDFLQCLSESIRICSRQIDTPSNLFNTEIFANEAIEIVKQLGLPIEHVIIKDKDLLEQGFGGLYSVGKAAVKGPVLLCFSHKPDGAKEDYAFVGKGIVFDTGGMQLKPPTGMLTMKVDMGGAAMVLGAFCTLAKSGFKQNLHCILCIAENNISPEATKPDDIIKMLSGKTVHITNTDAEGRLVLADGVTFAVEKLKVKKIITAATLTGAQKYATGSFHAAILANKEDSELNMVRAGRLSGDLCHPLIYAPDMHFQNLKSPVADMKNAITGSSFDGPPSSIAALFIGAQFDFNDDIDWVHVDFASPAFDGDRATGFGPALLCAAMAKNIDVPIMQ